MTTENQEQREDESGLVKTITNHLFLSSIPIGVFSAGILGLTELGIRYVTNANQSSVVTPEAMAVGLVGGIIGGLCDYEIKNDYKIINLYEIMAGLSVGSASVSTGLNYFLSGSIFY